MAALHHLSAFSALAQRIKGALTLGAADPRKHAYPFWTIRCSTSRA
jgi:hypothetical protein